MQTIPVDAARLGGFLALSVAPDADAHGTQKTDREGRPLWRVECLHRPPQTGDFAPKAQIEVIKIAAPAAPRVAEMTPVTFTGLVARFWEMSGRAGLSLSADAVHSAKGGE